ncbi:MAG: hypothetical protein HRU75_07980 [Planctomycetia bacterium]|nr:MAG: hypothetical protein HRU75_07980 [Planctomycetia bacterium]
MSKVRQQFPSSGGDFAAPPHADLRAYEVFVRTERGKPQVHAGTLEAPDDELALQYGREHYGRDQPCVEVWVVRRESILTADSDREVIFRLSDQSYRQAKGYSDVRRKWEKIRATKAVDEYQRDDLKEAF